MIKLPVAELVAPLSEAEPCGPDLEYDSAFVSLLADVQPKLARVEDEDKPPELPDWRAVYAQALALAHKTRDLRVLVLLARSGARLHGFSAYADALNSIATLLEQRWDTLHPQLDKEDNDDPTMRLSALAALIDLETGLADLRSATVGSGRSALAVRGIEIAFDASRAHKGESPMPPDGVAQALRDNEAHDSGTLAVLVRLDIDVARIDAALAQRVGASVGPNLRVLGSLAGLLAKAATQAGGGVAATTAGGAAAPSAGSLGTVAAASPLHAVGDITSRDDVVRLLDRVCEWIERNEPSNPAPLLIRRAQRLMSKSFLEIIRDLLPDDVGQVEKLAGADSAGST